MLPDADACAYARLLLDAGLDFQSGQCLTIGAEPIHWPLVNVIAAEAYQRGAKYVQVDAQHPALIASRVLHAPEDTLEFVPGYQRARAGETADIQWARLRLGGQEDPEVFASLPGQKLARLQRAERDAFKPVMRAAQADRLAWCVAAAPTPAWAAQVMEQPAGDATTAAFWEVMRRILRLDQEDPVATWQELAKVLHRRCLVLNELAFERVRLRSQSSGTDLEIGLHRGGLWLGGGAHLPDGRHFLPNLPTEEVFTTPDYRRCEGTLTVSRPVDVLGKEVGGAQFVFRDGKVVEYDAETGLDALEQLLELDAQAPFPGELALVDNQSPIYQSGLTFHNILFDENATCHLALGSAYPKAVPGAENWSQPQRLERGVNESLAHTDFMFGCDDLVVTGIQAGGREKTVLEAGQFVI